jgi:protein-arginine kinase activator protein McsA
MSFWDVLDRWADGIRREKLAEKGIAECPYCGNTFYSWREVGGRICYKCKKVF